MLDDEVGRPLARPDGAPLEVPLAHDIGGAPCRLLGWTPTGFVEQVVGQRPGEVDDRWQLVDPHVEELGGRSRGGLGFGHDEGHRLALVPNVVGRQHGLIRHDRSEPRHLAPPREIARREHADHSGSPFRGCRLDGAEPPTRDVGPHQRSVKHAGRVQVVDEGPGTRDRVGHGHQVTPAAAAAVLAASRIDSYPVHRQ